MSLSFEFNCCTFDNVILMLEEFFFWGIVDLKAMMKFKAQPPPSLPPSSRCSSQLSPHLLRAGF